MAGVWGSIEEVTLAGRGFAVPADVEATIKPGGTENEVLPNGDGTARLSKTRVNWNSDGLTLSIDDSTDDMDYIQDLANGSDLFPVSVTFASGVTRHGTGQVIGELSFNSKTGVAAVVLGGPGALARQ